MDGVPAPAIQALRGDPKRDRSSSTSCVSFEHVNGLGRKANEPCGSCATLLRSASLQNSMSVPEENRIGTRYRRFTSTATSVPEHAGRCTSAISRTMRPLWCLHDAKASSAVAAVSTVNPPRRRTARITSWTAALSSNTRTTLTRSSHRHNGLPAAPRRDPKPRGRIINICFR
jgi:hypothetical protein